MKMAVADVWIAVIQPVDNYEEITIHSNIDSYLDDVKELQKEWVDGLLAEFDIDTSEYSDAELTVLLRDADVSIITYPSFGGVLVKYKEEIIAEWSGPILKLRQDSNGYFYEVTIKFINYELGEK